MRVSEIFQSIQGEGPFVGHRAIFIRMHGCNLACDWCDTKYAWEEGPFYELSSQQVFDYICRIPSIRHIVFTGGEPLLQLEELKPLIEQLKENGRFVAVETNGTIIPEDFDLFDLIVVSPKGLNTADNWFEPSITHKNIELKFVVHQKNIDMTFDWIRSKGLSGVYVMPIGIDAESIEAGSRVVLSKMLEYHLDCILCPRIHVLLGMK